MIDKKYAPKKGVTRTVLAIALAGTCAFAQSIATDIVAETEETALPAVTVSANDGAAVAVEDTGVSVTVLNVEDLKNEGIFTLSNALTEVPGVYVIPGGGTNQQGNVSNIAIRGQSSGTYVLPTINGMRLSNANTALTANIVARTNLFNTGTLEILRGSQAATYGSGAIGGVIFMETPQGQGEPSIEIFNEYGSFDSYTGSFTAQGQEGNLSFYFNTAYQRTNNDLESADGTDFPYKHAGKAESWQETIRLDYQLNEDNKTTLSYQRQDSDYNYASKGSYHNYDWVTYDYLGIAQYSSLSQYSFMSDLVTAKHESKVSKEYTTSLMTGYYGTNDCMGGSYTNQLRNVQIEWRNTYEWNEQNKTDAGFAWNRSEYRANNGYDPAWGTAPGSQKSLENIYGVYTNHSYKPCKNWDNNIAFRLDSSSLFDELFTFRADSSYKFNQENTRVFASVGTGYDTPSQMELMKGYQTYGGYNYYGNPDLEKATSVSFDFGIEQKITDNHKVSATYFWIQEEDKIYCDWMPDYSGYTYYNADGQTLSQGVELSLSGKIDAAWDTNYSLSFTYTQPKMDDDSQINETARQLWAADINTKPCEKLLIGAGLVGAVGRSTWQGNKTDNYYTMRLYAKYFYSENVDFHIRLENLTDQKFVTEEAYGPLRGCDMINAGMGVYAGCTIKF